MKHRLKIKKHGPDLYIFRRISFCFYGRAKMDDLKAKLDKYMGNAKPAFESISALTEGGEKVKDTAERYYNDARHFMERGEYVNAFAALEYAEGWLDSGVVLGVVAAKGKEGKNF